MDATARPLTHDTNLFRSQRSALYQPKSSVQRAECGQAMSRSNTNIETFLVLLPWLFFKYISDSTLMSKVDIWTLRSFFLIAHCPVPSYRYDHTWWFVDLELQGAGDSPRSKWKLSRGWIRTTEHRIIVHESYHRAILILRRSALIL